MSGAGCPQPELLSNIWMQIFIVALHIKHAVEDDLALFLTESALLVLVATSTTAMPSKLMDVLVEAPIVAFRIHGQGFQAVFNVHFVDLEECLQLATFFETICATKFSLLLCPAAG